jgi:hypothetical protein
MNNQFNPMNMPMPNYPMFPVGNQMGMPGNMNMATIPKETKKKKKIKRLNLTFKEGTVYEIHIQCHLMKKWNQ